MQLFRCWRAEHTVSESGQWSTNDRSAVPASSASGTGSLVRSPEQLWGRADSTPAGRETRAPDGDGGKWTWEVPLGPVSARPRCLVHEGADVVLNQQLKDVGMSHLAMVGLASIRRKWHS